MDIYLVRRTQRGAYQNYRVSPLHSLIYHGVGSRPESDKIVKVPGGIIAGQPWPSLFNDNRESLRLTRSASVLPDISCPTGSTVVVTERLRYLLAEFENLEFLPVTIERFVDFAMPKIGDFSWYDDVEYPPGPDLDVAFMAAKESQVYKNRRPSLFELIVPNILHGQDRENRYRKVAKRLRPIFGSFCGDYGRRSDVALISHRFFEAYAIGWVGYMAYREDAFKVIAPFLNLDFFDIAIHRLK